MKKFLALVLALAMTLALAACVLVLSACGVPFRFQTDIPAGRPPPFPDSSYEIWRKRMSGGCSGTISSC